MLFLGMLWLPSIPWVGISKKCRVKWDFNFYCIRVCKDGKSNGRWKLHSFSIKAGLCDGILLTSFMDLYAKCGELRNSGQLLGEISSGSCITWKATSQSGFIQDGSYVEAIELFRQMLDSGLKPGAEILGSPLDACMLLGALQIGWRNPWVLDYLRRSLFHIPEEYTVCTQEPLSLTFTYNVETSTMEGFGIHGIGDEAVKHFDKMLEEEIESNSVTFLVLLKVFFIHNLFLWWEIFF